MRAKKQRGPYTEFGPWFKAQFGYNPPSLEEQVKYRKKALAAIDAADRARAVDCEADLRQRINDAAMKGWVAGFEAGKLAAKKEKMK